MKKSSILNTEQKKAVEHADGPLLIIAGAGTGKTTVITERVKYLLSKKDVFPSDILALTFTEKAAREMEERIDIALPYGYTQMWTLTFHAFCDRILRDEAINIGLSPAYKIASEAEAMLFLKKNLYKFELEYFRPLGNPYKFIQGMLQHFSRLKDDDITPEEYLQYSQQKAKSKKQKADTDELKRIAELSKAFVLYEKLKAEEGIMDFSDLNANILRLFRTRKNVLAHYQNKFRYILVDEFQDTNYAQNELAILLAGSRKNITVVGDDDQAIYRWRGAALANIIQFKSHFPKAKTITLNKNYRSTSEILNTSYKLIQNNNPDRLEIQEKIDKKLISMRNIKGDEVELLFGQRVENEADLVAAKIQELMQKQTLQYNDFAILVRANDHAQPFTRALERLNIPYQFLGPGHLFQQEEIKDLIAYLKVLYNFEDSASLYRVMTQSLFSFEARDIAAILNFAKKKYLSLFEALEQIDDTFLPVTVKEKAKTLVAMIKKHLIQVPKDTAGRILYYYLEDSGLMRKLLKPESATSEKRAQNIAKFFDKLRTYEVEHTDASVFSVVDWIDLSMQLGESPLSSDSDWSGNNAVNILTVHSSKGLEFPVVFITNLVTQRFPSRDRKEQIPIPDELVKENVPMEDQNLAEERRLFYVAMTRAKDYLFLTAANYYGEGKRERKISPFVYETLGIKYVDEIIQKRKIEQSAHQLSITDILQNISPINNSEGLENPQSQKNLFPVHFLSYSQITTFDICPLHYKLRYILRIPSFPAASLSFGSSVHAVLKDYFQAKKTLFEKEDINISLLLKQNWISEGYESKSHEKAAFTHAEKIITIYIKNNGKTKPLANEVAFQFSLGNLKIGGRIDRIDALKNGKIEIIDYKTGRSMLDEKKLAKDLQLTTYALAASMVKDPLFNKNPDEVQLSLVYLDSDSKLTTTRTQEQLEEAKKLYLQKADEISKSDFQCSMKNCKNCEYKILCQSFTS